MLAIRLLFAMNIDSLSSFGKPSRRTTLLSDKSMQSNWFCSTNLGQAGTAGHAANTPQPGLVIAPLGNKCRRCEDV